MTETRNKEIVLASEEVQRKNLLTVIEFGTETRKMVKELLIMVDALQNRMMMQDKKLDQYRLQLAALQQQFYAKGTTSYNDSEE